jgi:hypothetical protein
MTDDRSQMTIKDYQLRVAGCELLVAGCELLVAGYELRVTGYATVKYAPLVFCEVPVKHKQKIG